MIKVQTLPKDVVPPNGLIRYATAKLKYAHDYRTSSDTKKAAMVAFPEKRARLEKELNDSVTLGSTPDGKIIYLVDHRLNSSVIRELGRLRELTFRAVGEGTQRLRDTDRYDKIYRHIVLWDKDDREIVGAYRIGEAFKLTQNGNLDKLYTAELFQYGPAFKGIFPKAVELGRSFIQPKYWTRRGLDYLWQGIGAYLLAQPDVRYLFGAVSISNDYPELAKQQIVGLYQHFFTPENHTQFAFSKHPFRVDRGVLESYRTQNLLRATRALKSSLSRQGVTLPTLYKHYADLCHEQGVNFIDFSVDPNFSYCIDGLILVDLELIKESKKKRYLTPN